MSTAKKRSSTTINSRLLRLHDDENHPDRGIYWCLCGAIKSIRDCHVSTGSTRSCGCLRSEVTTARSTRHGEASRALHSTEYDRWRDMLKRCATHPDYLGRGIIVCERWQKSFTAFLTDMGRCPFGLSLDRRDNNRGYGPDNCRWATHKQQSNNRRSSPYIEFGGKRQTISEWAVEVGIGYFTLRNRLLKLGWPIPDALFHPVQKAGAQLAAEHLIAQRQNQPA